MPDGADFKRLIGFEKSVHDLLEFIPEHRAMETGSLPEMPKKRTEKNVMRCLVCNGPAEDIAPADFDGRVIDCPTCESYEIADSVLHKFDKFSLEKRADALRKAKRFASPRTRPTITNFCL